MAAEHVYRDLGISFRYPEGWQLSEESAEDAITITVNRDAAFWSITLLKRRPPVDEVLKQATNAFEEEYESVDCYESEVPIARRTAIACDLEFVCLELINSVFLRAFRTGRFTVFVMYQVTDHERENFLELFQEISNSLECDLDDDIIIA